MTAADFARVDVPAAQVAAEIRIRHECASRVEPKFVECAHCGSRSGPWVPEPHGARYSNDSQVLVCKDRCTPADPERHAIDPADSAFAAAASTFRRPARDEDYPEWAAQLAARTNTGGTA
ncbi:hypothetical protein QMZ92_23825 [Streptomyces sp. HNM0645]|uniref:hypothetical protein n=1 Tax=Streptomyces sp. HNM0645 TaxID=2782343 RepID=UPI0024B68853|nr:hypothetical protein [Streptomyces sp. HNM0645]MDI9887315.1 hypothetical protein [Streptomyces sp. HNM0645]